MRAGNSIQGRRSPSLSHPARLVRCRADVQSNVDVSIDRNGTVLADEQLDSHCRECDRVVCAGLGRQNM